ncbi:MULTISPECIES: hypothetical protein, partial [unclassified Providencia]
YVKKFNATLITILQHPLDNANLGMVEIIAIPSLLNLVNLNPANFNKLTDRLIFRLKSSNKKITYQYEKEVIKYRLGFLFF